ncbi:MAG: hypothetical protein PUB21_02300 [Bacteroidales bacterium]|nr:hypothetical protein [Bacteroidales bacterium]
MEKKYAEALLHYSAPEDSLKRKALLFLLHNMDNKFGTDPMRCDKFVERYRIVYNLAERKDYDFKHDYLTDIGYPPVHEKFIPDTAIVTSQDLINNVDLAFEAWQRPWAKHLTFQEFCAYILPYRFENEPFCNNWRSFFIRELQPFTDSLQQNGITDPLLVCDALATRFYARTAAYLSPLPYIKVTDYYYYPTGDCNKWNILIGLAGRAIGLPVALDFNLQFARYPGSHIGSVLTNDGRGHVVSFLMNLDGTMDTYVYDGVKIYRDEFARQPQSFINRFYSRYKSRYIKDVTAQYAHHFNMKSAVVPLPSKKWKGDLYLCSFGIGEEIVPLCCPEIKNDSVYLHDLLLTTEILFFFGSYDKAREAFVPLGNPFALDKSGTVISIFNPGERNDSVVIRRKYPILYDEYPYFNQVFQASVQGSDDRMFRNAVTLATADLEKIRSYYEFQLPEHQRFRFYRYLPAEGNSLNLAELHFWTKDSSGKNSLTTSYYTNKNAVDTAALNKLCDDLNSTNYISDEDKWVAIDMGENTVANLSKVGVLPRNNLNNVEKNALYELFYFDLGWHSLGKKTADDFVLHWKNIPSNAIFLLKGYNAGVQERIFMNENGEQNFW